MSRSILIYSIARILSPEFTIYKILAVSLALPDLSRLVFMDQYQEIIWYWYIFENRTLNDTHHILTTRINEDNSQRIQQGMGHMGTRTQALKSLE